MLSICCSILYHTLQCVCCQSLADLFEMQQSWAIYAKTAVLKTILDESVRNRNINICVDGDWSQSNCSKWSSPDCIGFTVFPTVLHVHLHIKPPTRNTANASTEKPRSQQQYPYHVKSAVYMQLLIACGNAGHSHAAGFCCYSHSPAQEKRLTATHLVLVMSR